MSSPDSLAEALRNARACRLCHEHLPRGPRPVLRAAASARLLIVGQAPGTRVHETGIPWNDRSGDRLRDWLGLDRASFYDERQVAIVPMGFCYPGVDRNGGDRPPRPECAPLWHPQIIPQLRHLELTLFIGTYAQRRYLGELARGGVSATVARWRDMPADRLALPHPSWRNTAWLSRHPWFEAELLPELRARVRSVLAQSSTTDASIRSISSSDSP